MLCLLLAFMMSDLSDLGIHTKGWINEPSNAEVGKTLTLIFHTRKCEKKTLTMLDQLKGTKGQIVILTPDGEDYTRKFVEENKVQYSVGFGLRHVRKFKIKSWPKIAVLEWKNDKLSLEDSPIIPEFSDPNLQKLASTLIAGNADERVTALREFSKSAAPEDTILLCDALNAFDPPDELNDHFIKRAMWYGRIAQTKKEAEEPGSPRQSEAELIEFRRDPVVDATVTTYKEKAKVKTFLQLRNDFLSRIDATEPSEVLIRIAVISEVEKRDPRAARTFLLEACKKEKDPYIRWHAVGALGYVTKPDDPEADMVVREIETMLESEKDVRKVRPVMQELISYLQNGQ